MRLHTSWFLSLVMSCFGFFLGCLVMHLILVIKTNSDRLWWLRGIFEIWYSSSIEYHLNFILIVYVWIASFALQIQCIHMSWCRRCWTWRITILLIDLYSLISWSFNWLAVHTSTRWLSSHSSKLKLLIAIIIWEILKLNIFKSIVSITLQ